MITAIGYKNFKCFNSQVTVPTSNINLLAGINGRGKSTVLQGLLLMRQSPEHSRTTDQIIFNGSCVELGSFDDVRSTSVSRTEPLEMSFEFGSNRGQALVKYILRENPSDEMVAKVDEVELVGAHDSNSFVIQLFPQGPDRYLIYDGVRRELPWRNLLFDRVQDWGEPFSFINNVVTFTRIHYIAADRIGPRDFYPRQSFADFPNVGAKGEYTANILSKKRDDEVTESLCLLAGSSNTVLDQSEAWLSKIFDGGKIKITPTEANIVLLAMNSEQSSNTYKPINVGFGYSYALPIIVSGLIARPGEKLIVENPEAHLHPYAQSQISVFLSKVSMNGVQVYIESHSDHILNGLRLAVHDQILQPDHLSILSFDRNTPERVMRIPIEQDGSIKHWPDGFFDQATSDLAKLLNV
jgi:predicted ATPase